MLRFWPSGPADQTTPRASAHHVAEPNPFDDPALTSPAAAPATVPATVTSTTTTRTPGTPSSRLAGANSASSRNHSRSNSANPNPHHHTHPTLTAQHLQMPSSPGGSATATHAASASGTRTPTNISTHNNLHHHLLNAHIGTYHPPRTASTVSAGGTGTHGDTTPTGPLTPGGSFSTASPATTQLTLQPPDFHMKAPPLKRSQTATPANANTNANGNTNGNNANGNSIASSRGQIHVKLIAARGLNVSSPSSRPYVVVQFEQNEFVGRDPIAETDKEAKGVATNLSRTNSSSALGTLERAAGNLSLRGRGGAQHQHQNQQQHQQPLHGGQMGLFGSASARSAYNPVWKHEVSFDVTSDESSVTFNVYDRAQEPEPFLGTLELKPVLIHEHTVDQWHKLRARDSSEVVTGEIRVQLRYEQLKSKRHLTPRDFEFMKLIGRGTFGRVFQVRKKDTRRIYAMKVLSKKEIVAKKEVAHTIGERKILTRALECPFLVGLKFSFQTETDLYLITDFKSGGELFWHLQRETRFTEERARFYIAELVLALEHLHKYDIVYRDLKPENILLDATGHVALCDFGLSKPDLPADQLTNTFCGTTEYLAPEVLLDDHGYSKLVDFWSLGVLLFEMCCGWSPFYAEDTQQMYKNICFGKIRFPKGVISEEGKQFVKGLLNRNPKHRLGAQHDAAELKEHPFFHGIDWTLLAQKKVTPPFKPNVESDESTANFDPEFTGADLKDVGIDINDYDVDDPSDGWTAQKNSSGANGSGQTVWHGPQGSQREAPSPPVQQQNGKANGQQQQQGRAMPIHTANGKPAEGTKRGSPLTSSVQANFQGFTYSGESVLAGASDFLAEREARMRAEGGAEEDAVSDEEEGEGEGEDELDEETVAGRYARRGRGEEMDTGYP